MITTAVSVPPHSVKNCWRPVYNPTTRCGGFDFGPVLPGRVVVYRPIGRCSDDSNGVTGQQLDSGWSLANDLALEQGSLAVADETAVVIGGETDGSIGAHWSVDGFVWEPGEGLPESTDWHSAAVAGGPRGFVAIASRTGVVPNEAVIVFSRDGSDWEVIDVQDLPSPR